MSDCDVSDSKTASIPPEIWNNIFAFIPECKLGVLTQICKQWRSIIHSTVRYISWKTLHCGNKTAHTASWHCGHIVTASVSGHIFVADCTGVSLIRTGLPNTREDSNITQHSVALLHVSSYHASECVVHIYLSNSNRNGPPELQLSIFKATPALTLMYRGPLNIELGSHVRRSSMCSAGNTIFIANNAPHYDGVNNTNVCAYTVSNKSTPLTMTTILDVKASCIFATEEYLFGCTDTTIWCNVLNEFPTFTTTRNIDITEMQRSNGPVTQIIAATCQTAMLLCGSILIAANCQTGALTVVPVQSSPRDQIVQCEIRQNIIYVVLWGPSTIQFGQPILHFSGKRTVKVYVLCMCGQFHPVKKQNITFSFKEHSKHMVLVKTQ